MRQSTLQQEPATDAQRPAEPPAWLIHHQVRDDVLHPDDVYGLPPEGFISYYGRMTLSFVIEAAKIATRLVFESLFWVVFALISLIGR
ncbi:hypothetical protein [Bradyrhizobium sp. 2TAF24]|uniref:hypothetical protein n=1 Tax=Bradyrhizobium sp. 2TAF24 TaxID=3233011 RepID=UPI003F93D8AB